MCRNSPPKGNGAIALNGRWYRGQMVLLRSAGGRLNVVNYVDLESYIQGVLAGEVPSSWPEECLKAQAVAALSADELETFTGALRKIVQHLEASEGAAPPERA